VLPDVLGNVGAGVPELEGAVVPELPRELDVVGDGLGDDAVVDEDVEGLVDELPGGNKGRSAASSSWLEYHQ